MRRPPAGWSRIELGQMKPIQIVEHATCRADYLNHWGSTAWQLVHVPAPQVLGLSRADWDMTYRSVLPVASSSWRAADIVGGTGSFSSVVVNTVNKTDWGVVSEKKRKAGSVVPCRLLSNRYLRWKGANVILVRGAKMALRVRLGLRVCAYCSQRGYWPCDSLVNLVEASVVDNRNARVHVCPRKKFNRYEFTLWSFSLFLCCSPCSSRILVQYLLWPLISAHSHQTANTLRFFTLLLQTDPESSTRGAAQLHNDASFVYTAYDFLVSQSAEIDDVDRINISRFTAHASCSKQHRSTPAGDPFLFITALSRFLITSSKMNAKNIAYDCPHLNTCSSTIKRKKKCTDCIALNKTGVMRHAASNSLHPDCSPECPAYGSEYFYQFCKNSSHFYSRVVDFFTVNNFAEFPFTRRQGDQVVLQTQNESTGQLPSFHDVPGILTKVLFADMFIRSETVPDASTRDHRTSHPWPLTDESFILKIRKDRHPRASTSNHYTEHNKDAWNARVKHSDNAGISVHTPAPTPGNFKVGSEFTTPDNQHKKSVRKYPSDSTIENDETASVSIHRPAPNCSDSSKSEPPSKDPLYTTIHKFEGAGISIRWLPPNSLGNWFASPPQLGEGCPVAVPMSALFEMNSHPKNILTCLRLAEERSKLIKLALWMPPTTIVKARHLVQFAPWSLCVTLQLLLLGDGRSYYSYLWSFQDWAVEYYVLRPSFPLESFSSWPGVI